jgi:hypothetical protein
MKKILLSVAAGLMLLAPFAAAPASAQVVVRVGPRYHHHHYYRHHHYYHHSHYYRHY